MREGHCISAVFNMMQGVFTSNKSKFSGHHLGRVSQKLKARFFNVGLNLIILSCFPNILFLIHSFFFQISSKNAPHSRYLLLNAPVYKHLKLFMIIMLPGSLQSTNYSFHLILFVLFGALCRSPVVLENFFDATV